MAEQSNGASVKVHFFYVVVILLLAIILLAASEWTKLQGFTDYLTAAGTMVSIVLGILAIIYSFVSNDSLSKSLGGVSSSAQEIQNARIGISEVTIAAKSLLSESKTNSEELKIVLREIQNEVQTLRTASSDLQSSTSSIADAVKGMPDRFDKLENQLGAALNNANVSLETSEKVSTNVALTEQILTQSSLAGKVMFYVCALSLENKRAFSLSEFSLLKENFMYFIGFIVACKAAGVISYKCADNFDPSRKFEIINFPMSSIRSLEVINEGIPDSSASQEYWHKTLNEIQALFGCQIK